MGVADNCTSYDPKTTEVLVCEHVSSDPVILTDIYRPEINAVTWTRELDSLVQVVAQQLVNFDPNFQLRIEGKLNGVSQSLFEHLSHIESCEELIADIVVLVDMFSELFDLRRIGLRLAVLTDAMCPKFHVDQVPCRLITTYLGAGTERLLNQQVTRDNKGAIAKVDTSNIQSNAAGDVLLLKGEAWEGNEGNGAVHRSPNVDVNIPRLVLTLDFA